MNPACIDLLLSASVVLVFAGALFGTFYRMRSGFGPFNTSVLIVVLVVFASTILVQSGKIEWQSVSNLFFSVIGFAGGLLAHKMQGIGANE